MSDTHTLLARFIDEWNAGRRPSVESYLEEVPDRTARDEFVDQLSTFLTYAPTPDYDDPTIAELLREPAVEAAATVFESEGSAWRSLLPRLRTRAGLSLSELASQVLAAAGLGDEGQEKAARHLEAMERGDLDATRVSGRLVAVLGRVLRIDQADLLRTGMPATGPAPVSAMFRRETSEDQALGARLDLAADALATPASDAAWDEVDELFFGHS